MFFPVSTTVVGAVLLILHTLWVANLGEAGPRLSNEEMRRHLKWKVFYLNPSDPRGWVPRLWGIGYTVNFRAEHHIWTFVALLLLTLGSGLATAWSAFYYLPCGA